MSLSGNDALKLSGAMMVTFCARFISLSLSLSRTNERITKFVKNKTRVFFSLALCATFPNEYSLHQNHLIKIYSSGTASKRSPSRTT